MAGLKEKVVDIDIFGPVIGLNFRGRSRFKTLRGGLLTILLNVVAFYQSMNLLMQLYTQEDPKISVHEVSHLA